jgi:glycosyltransferase involved in cell wall biosynthesis
MDRDLLLGDAHLFLHTAFAEGHPIAILEAAAAGIPILASDIPSIRESLGDGGWYFKAGDSASSSKSLKNVSTHRSEAIDLSRQLAGHVKARY